MGQADYLKLGSHNAICDVCGFKFKIEQLFETWDGFYACKVNGCWNPRQPQDYVRGGTDNLTVEVSRPEAIDVFVPESETGPLPPQIYP